MTLEKIDSKPEKRIPQPLIYIAATLVAVTLCAGGAWNWHRNIEIDQSQYREVMRASKGNPEIRHAIDRIMKEDGQISNRRYDGELSALLAKSKPLALPGASHRQISSSRPR